MAGGKRGGPGRGSVTQPGPKDGEVSEAADDQERDAQFKLAFLESLDDPQIATKLGKLVTDANKHLVDLISTLREEVTSLRTALHDRDATIAQLRGEVQRLEDAHDALEQHGRRHCLRVSGISDAEDDTTAAVVSLANTVLKVQPPLQAEDISVSHRLRKPRNAGEDEPSPIIIRFVRRHDRDRVIKERKKLKLYNETRPIKTYINEDLTTRRARLFAAVRSLQKKKLFKQAWTYNGNIKVTMLNGEVKSINNAQDIHTLLPDADFVFHG